MDSSAAALLLHREEGRELVGLTMKLFSPEATAGIDPSCCTERDILDAKAVCDALGIAHHVLPLYADFEKHVIDNFIDAYRSGRTPNPCIDCNRYLKFEALFQRAAEMGCDTVATGHYARVEYDKAAGRYKLKKGADGSKDQGYVLYSLTQEQLSRVIFPLGGFTKNEIRTLAAESGLVSAFKRESQDICFIPDGDYAGFIERHTGLTFPCGDFIDTSGHVLGRHKGIIHYTVGQRKGLGISSDEPLYVLSIDPAANVVTLGREHELYRTTLIARHINLISVPDLEKPMRVTAKARYRQPEARATAVQTGNDELTITFDEPLRAITPGQSVVLYSGDEILGGGMISRADV